MITSKQQSVLSLVKGNTPESEIEKAGFAKIVITTLAKQGLLARGEKKGVAVVSITTAGKEALVEFKKAEKQAAKKATKKVAACI